MTKYEHILDTITHKKYVLEACQKLMNLLYQENRLEEAYELAERCLVHDQSKIEQVELKNFTELDNAREGMKIASRLMTDKEKEIISIHWKHNRHHPEHFDDYHEMNEVDIMEMCCDWYSRSLQFKTDFLGFIKSRQEQRFKFDEEFFSRVMKYCNYLSV